MTEKIVMTNSDEATAAIFGAFDSNIRMIERAFDVRIFNRNKDSEDGDAIVVTGDADAVDRAVRTLEYLKHMSGAGEMLGEQSVEYVIGLVKDNSDESPENLSRDVSLDTLARRFFVSKYYLCRAFKKHNGVSVHGYINHKRVMYAKQLIEQGETASGAAYKVGFGDYSAFYRAYVKIIGKAPTA